MRKFLYFICADAVHLQSRLERLGKRGLELVDTQGLFTGEFGETKREDLQYLVIPYGNQKYFPEKVDASLYGWELMGGFNGMAIFKSMPCVEPKRDALVDKMKQDGLLHQDRHCVPLLLVLLFAMGALLYLAMQRFPAIAEGWYLSYAGICVPALCTVCFGLLAANLVALRSYVAAWIHGLTAIILVGSVFLALLLWQLDNSGDTVYFVGLLLVLALALALTFWRLNRVIALVMPCLCLVVLVLGFMFPNIDQVESSGVGLRHMAEERQMVTLADLEVDERLSVSGYRREGTFLVGVTTYWELSEAGSSISCEVYSCAATALADDVSEQLRSVGTWEQVGEGFIQADGKTVLLRRNKTVAVVSYREPLTQNQISLIYQRLFG